MRNEGLLPYYTRRLLPFFLVYFGYEALEVGWGLLAGQSSGEGSSIDILGLLNETTISFLFSILPYLLYLLVLPAPFHGGRKDRAVTLGLFSLFCLVNAAEELAELLSGDNFHLLTASLLRQPSRAMADMAALPHLIPAGCLALLLVAGSIFFFRKRLVSELRPPSAPARLLVPFVLSTAAFILTQAQTGLELHNPAPELYSDGLFSLFGGIFAFTAVPDLKPIFAFPCAWVAVGIAVILLLRLCLTQYGGERGASLLGAPMRLWDALCARYGRFRVQLFCLLVFVLLVRLCSLGLYPLMDTTEARYGEMARKMIETGNWLQPQFDYGIPFWGKPPLAFQASAAVMSLLGLTPFAARLAPFLACLCMGLLFYAWFPREERWEKGSACFIVFFTCAMGFVAAGAVMTDAYLALGVMLALVSFRRAALAPGGAPYWGYLFFVGLAVGLMSKGPLALVLCVLPLLVPALLLPSCRRKLQSLPWLGGTLLLLLLTVPWYVAAERATPGFLRYFLIGEHIERFLVKGWTGDLYGSGHARPLGSIWLYAVEMFLPWVLIVPFLLRRSPGKPSPERKEERLYLWLWGLSPLLLFTAARNILPAYVLPGIPAFCILFIHALWEKAGTCRAVKQFIFLPVPLLLLLSLFMMGGGFSHIRYRCDRDMLQQAWDGVSPLLYARERATYSGQFYSGGKARVLQEKPDALPPGSCLVAPENSPLLSSLRQSPDWEQAATGHRLFLFRKKKD